MLKEYVAPRALLLALALIASDAALAQTIGPRPFSPPSYGPPPPALTGYQMSQVGSGFNFTFIAEISEVQKFLPAGYSALPTATGATTTGVTVLVTTNSFLNIPTNTTVPSLPNGGPVGFGLYGPFESFDLVVGTLNPVGVFESVFIARFVSNVEIAEVRNAFSGAIDTRYAAIKVSFVKEAGVGRMKVVVDDPDFGLKVTAVQTGADTIVASPRGFPPFGFGLHTLNTTVSPPTLGAGGVFSASSNNSAVFTDPAAIEVPRQALRLAGGRLKTLSVIPGNFFFEQEVFVKYN